MTTRVECEIGDDRIDFTMKTGSTAILNGLYFSDTSTSPSIGDPQKSRDVNIFLSDPKTGKGRFFMMLREGVAKFVSPLNGEFYTIAHEP